LTHDDYEVNEIQDELKDISEEDQIFLKNAEHPFACPNCTRAE
jgi:hypothetical protein